MGATDLPQTIDLLRGARLEDGSRVDVRLHDDAVADVAAAGELDVHNPAATLELDGWLLLTAPAEPHAHLDKALSFDLSNRRSGISTRRSPTGGPTRRR